MSAKKKATKRNCKRKPDCGAAHGSASWRVCLKMEIEVSDCETRQQAISRATCNIGYVPAVVNNIEVIKARKMPNAKLSA
jgi:hypothetical protein